MKSGKIRRSSRGAKAVLIRSTGRVVRFGRNGFALFPFAIRSVAAVFLFMAQSVEKRYCAFLMMLFNAGVLYL